MLVLMHTESNKSLSAYYNWEVLTADGSKMHGSAKTDTTEKKIHKNGIVAFVYCNNSAHAAIHDKELSILQLLKASGTYRSPTWKLALSHGYARMAHNILLFHVLALLISLTLAPAVHNSIHIYVHSFTYVN